MADQMIDKELHFMLEFINYLCESQIQSLFHIRLHKRSIKIYTALKIICIGFKQIVA